MLLAIAASALALAASEQPAAVPDQPRYRDCPDGSRVREDERCPIMVPPPPMIFFGFDEVSLTERARLTLDYVAQNTVWVAGGTSNFRLELQSHADRAGSDHYNLSLSRRRGEAVRDYLVNRGILRDRISITAFGESRPYVETEDRRPEPDNRRVVILFFQVR